MACGKLTRLTYYMLLTSDNQFHIDCILEVLNWFKNLYPLNYFQNSNERCMCIKIECVNTSFVCGILKNIVSERISLEAVFYIADSRVTLNQIIIK